ncbi:hypothetical protein K438DRAFT_1968567 [Mycena galopus ATCC 62051]|nr:hypothetical protein K438DRAFT_1968567 [Mycena galopus ATCC 62051]
MVIRDVKHCWNYRGYDYSGLLLRKEIDKWVINWEESRPLLLSLEGLGIA